MKQLARPPLSLANLIHYSEQTPPFLSWPSGRYAFEFLKSMKNLENVEIIKELMEIYSIKLTLKLVWTTDILKENSKHIQVLKIWSILPSLVIPELAKHLDIVFGDYKMNVINRWKEKLIEGDLVLPKTWPTGVNGRGNTAFTSNGDPSEDLANRLALLHCIT
ncbi:hypothetical protein LIER_09412 [Lithospermum erythrorhizon]|uniref:Uncharacterized protein n=1 Tax=Lithospermum erythrorhizon TaxID=34254 RepID=A0AAV3PGQ9_LITER